MTKPISLVNVDKYKDRVFFRLSISRWGNAAQVKDSGALQEYLRLKNAPETEQVNGTVGGTNGKGKADAVDAVSSRKRLIKSEKLDELIEFINGVRDRLIGKYRGMALPSGFMRGVYTVRKELVEEVDSIIAEAQKRIAEEFGPALANDYPEAIERARTLPVRQGGLGPLFDDNDYPTAEDVVSRFGLEGQYLQIGVSDKLSDELRKRAEAKFEQQISNALDESINALRVGFAELVEHAADKLRVEPGQKPKVFRDTLIGNLSDFIATFKMKDFGDEALASLVAKAEAIIKPNGETLDPDKLRKFANVRENTATAFGEIKNALDGMIVTKKGRSIDLSED